MEVETSVITKELLAVTNAAIRVALRYEKASGRKLGITGEVAEILVCDKLGLKLLRNPISTGYDALDDKGKRYQIKSKRVINNEGRMGSFSKHKFDFAVLVIFDEKYKIVGIWKATYKKLLPIIERHKRRNPSIREFKNIAKCVHR